MVKTLRRSKAAVCSLLESDKMARLAAHPRREYKRKENNRSQNAERNAQVFVGRHAIETQQVQVNRSTGDLQDRDGNVVAAAAEDHSGLIEQAKKLGDMGRREVRRDSRARRDTRRDTRRDSRRSSKRARLSRDSINSINSIDSLDSFDSFDSLDMTASRQSIDSSQTEEATPAEADTSSVKVETEAEVDAEADANAEPENETPANYVGNSLPCWQQVYPGADKFLTANRVGTPPYVFRSNVATPATTATTATADMSTADQMYYQFSAYTPTAAPVTAAAA